MSPLCIRAKYKYLIGLQFLNWSFICFHCSPIAYMTNTPNNTAPVFSALENLCFVVSWCIYSIYCPWDTYVLFPQLHNITKNASSSIRSGPIMLFLISMEQLQGNTMKGI